jgi:hypothetical protein
MAGLALLVFGGGVPVLHAQTTVGGDWGFTRDVNDRAETFFQFLILSVFGIFRLGFQTPAEITGWTPPAMLDGRPEVPTPFFGWKPPSQLQREVAPQPPDEPLPEDARRPGAQGRAPAEENASR